MIFEILLLVRKFFCIFIFSLIILDWLFFFILLSIILDWLFFVTEECGDFRVERDEGRILAEGSGEEGIWLALVGRSFYRKYKIYRYS